MGQHGKTQGSDPVGVGYGQVSLPWASVARFGFLGRASRLLAGSRIGHLPRVDQLGHLALGGNQHIRFALPPVFIAGNLTHSWWKSKGEP